MKQEVDQFIREKFELGELEYNPAQWQKLKIRLEQEKKKQHKLLGLGFTAFLGSKKMLAAASICLLVGIGSYIYVQQSTKSDPSLTQIKPIEHQNKSTSQQEINPSSKTTTNATTNILPTPQLTAVPKTSLPAISQLNAKSSQQKKKESAVHQTPFANIKNAIAQEVETKQLATKELNTPVNKVIEDANETEFVPENKITGNTDRFRIFEDLKQPKSSNANGLSLFGSIGMGTNQSAYAAGISYTLNMSPRFFIDGGLQVSSSKLNEVALFNSGDEKKLTNFSTDGNSIGGSVPVASFETNNLDLVSQSINYTHLTFNPSVGYRLTKSIFVQAGVDLQQRLTKTSTLNFVSQNDLLIYLPLIDMGLTPKIGYSLNKHWQASMLYRKGVNQWIHNKQTFNRDYLQVQLGYKL